MFCASAPSAVMATDSPTANKFISARMENPPGWWLPRLPHWRFSSWTLRPEYLGRQRAAGGFWGLCGCELRLQPRGGRRPFSALHSASAPLSAASACGTASARGSLGDDPASREAAESQKNSTDNKQPLGDLCLCRRQIVDCRDRLLLQLSDYSDTTIVCRRKSALCWQVTHDRPVRLIPGNYICKRPATCEVEPHMRNARIRFFVPIKQKPCEKR